MALKAIFCIITSMQHCHKLQIEQIQKCYANQAESNERVT